MPNNNSNDEDGSKKNAYVVFLESRIDECMAENKRYLQKYAEMRNFSFA
eukprot:CAMPEP_0176374072 /NCGR_PEP_ID=MMETSP0126-20121128/26500_1 /TAXON_ID=141414 ORGANISM="Strombidinopsis acuminatum, Strain SPMC142" /NCGR_SAMPLE_ID=MMETSP0126 /ASSEMBLY_ACC=CAM_ASM_000229 /LENGTH=48 /DNA_ID= /DNA_START= /DNA_END= /DNA_ORIENTATION=